MELNEYDIIIVGCGLSGVVIAEQFASKQNKKILIIDNRNHIGGNCYDYYDTSTNILMNKYGAHLFHTNDDEVFEYINKFCKWLPWEHKVLGLIDDKYVPIPANIITVNELCQENIKNENEMNAWLNENQISYNTITNGEEMAKSRVGKVLYEKIFKHYTYKQWKKYPEELAPEVLARIPVRNSFDDRYFSDKYQVLPEKGYTAFFQSILDKYKENIDVRLSTDFFDIKHLITKEQLVIYTGPIDKYFADKGLPKLEYRSIDFHIERKMNTDFYQPFSVVNYPGSNTPYTRCIEYKHFLNQKSDHTVFVKETTTDVGEPYYPVLNDRNKDLYQKYQKMAEQEEDNIHFIGRLASYKYFNMDQAIKNSLDYFKEHFEKEYVWLYISDYKDNRLNDYWLELQKFNSDYDIIILNDSLLYKYIDSENLNFFKKIKTIQLKSDFIRLYLLYNYGGVWMDCTVLTNIRINKIKYNIFINTLYNTKNELDFIESSYLHFDKNNIIIKKLFDIFKKQLTLNKYSIYEGKKGEKIKLIYKQISDKIGGSISHWCNYLLLYGCHSWLYYYDNDYMSNFKKLKVGDFNSMGYQIQNHYNWNMPKVFENINQLLPLGTNYFFKISLNHLKEIYHNKLYFENKNIFKLIIARYNECIKWSNIYSGNRIIYDKGNIQIDKSILAIGDEYYTLPNLGRESDTIFNYIIENYENLPDYVGFSQGSLKDHEWVRKDWGPIMFINMLKEAKTEGYSNYNFCNSNNSDFNLEFNYEIAKTYDKNVFNNNITFIEFLKKINIYDDYCKDLSNNKISIYPSAFMVISKKNILSRSKNYYKNLIKYCNYHVNPIEGHYFERAWTYIFNCRNTDFIFFMRGHIRDAFKTDRLKKFVKLLKSNFPGIKFILQTWEKQECLNTDSWREIKENNNIISKSIIEEYFQDKDITENCLILDEKSIKLIGSTDGYIGLTKCPIKGWKNMWYGIYHGLNQTFINKNSTIVSFRFDYFNIYESRDINENSIIRFIETNLKTDNIKFLKNNTGCDNLYIGRYRKMKALTEEFYLRLDNILANNKNISHQEFLLNITNEQLFEYEQFNEKKKKKKKLNFNSLYKRISPYFKMIRRRFKI